MKKILVCLIFLFLVSTPIYAESVGIHGSASFRYELADDYPGQCWKIDLHYTFINWFVIGASETTGTNGYNTYFDSIPAFVPENQLYEFYIQSNIGKNVSIKVSQWCLHPIYSGQKNIKTDIPQGVYIECNYKF